MGITPGQFERIAWAKQKTPAAGHRQKKAFLFYTSTSHGGPRTINVPFTGPRETAAVAASALLLVALTILLAIPMIRLPSTGRSGVCSFQRHRGQICYRPLMSELISQWKWILFTRKSRPLLEFERINAASRGSMGSLTQRKFRGMSPWCSNHWSQSGQCNDSLES